MPTNRFRPTNKMKFTIYELMLKHTKPVDGKDGFIVFEDGWNDTKIAETVAQQFNEPRLNKTHVTRYRLESVGRTVSANADKAVKVKKQTGKRLAALEAAFNALCDYLDTVGHPGALPLKVQLQPDTQNVQ